MAYNDELGFVLDRMSKRELQTLAIEYLKEESKDIKPLSKSALCQYCSESLRSAAGHSFANILRDEHELPYKEIVQDVAKFLKIDSDETEIIEEIEHKILLETSKKAWSKLSDDEKEKLLKQMQSEIDSQEVEEKITLTMDIVEKLFDSMTNINSDIFLSGVMKAKLATSYTGVTATAIGKIAGYTMLQTVVLQTIISYVGYIAAAQAVLGIGVWGGVMGAAGLAGPVGMVVGGLYGVHKLAGPAYRKTVPSVLFIAQKRKEINNWSKTKKLFYAAKPYFGIK